MTVLMPRASLVGGSQGRETPPLMGLSSRDDPGDELREGIWSFD